MSSTHATRTDDAGSRRSGRDGDLVAILAMLAILALTVVCFVAQGAVPV